MVFPAQTIAAPPVAPTFASSFSVTGAVAGRTLREIEMEHILRVLAKNNGSKRVAAEELGISLKTLYNKLNQHEEEQRRAAG